MWYKSFRILLIAVVLVCALGVQPSLTAQAIPAPSAWADRTPVLDGKLGVNEWLGASTIFNNFSVIWKNDAQFLYLLIDVFNDNPAAPNPIASNENFVIGVDVDKNGAATAGVDVAYYLNSSLASHPLMKQTSLGGGSWSAGAATTSYAVAGFGPDLDWSTPHRYYEVAIRLSNIGTLPMGTLRVGFSVYSASPSFTENQPAINSMSSYQYIGLAAPRAVFIYNNTDTQDPTDAAAFQTILATYGGIYTDLLPMGSVEGADLSPYQSIIVGHATGNANNNTWLGSASAEAKIRQTGKPVLGIGYGGSELFDDLGLYIGWPSSAGDFISGNVDIKSTDHTAWNFPNDLSKSSPFAVYSSTVADEVTYINSSSPLKRLTLLANQDTDPNYYPFIGEEANRVCYTLWGFHSAPNLLTTNGKKLFANMVANPICRPSVLYLGGGDTTLRDGVVTNLLRNAGFYVAYDLAANASTLNYTDIGLIVVGWDSFTAWNTVANVNAIRNSHLPVLAMGEGGDQLFVKLGLNYNGTNTKASTPQTDAMMVNPLQPALRAPYPIYADSTLVATIDASAAGVDEFLPAAKSPNVIGSLVTSPSNYHSILTQAYNNTCYSYWGFEDYVVNMTVLAKNLFRNLATKTNCNYPQFVPLTKK